MIINFSRYCASSFLPPQVADMPKLSIILVPAVCYNHLSDVFKYASSIILLPVLDI